MNRSIPYLLRRTLLAAGAFLALAVSVPSIAQQTVTLTDQSGTPLNLTTQSGSAVTCSFNGSATVTPNGGLTITCLTGSPTLASLVLSGVPSSLNISSATTNTSATITVSRSGGTGSFDATITVSGACTSTASGTTVTFAASGASSTIPVSAAATTGTCSVQVAPTTTGVSTSASTSFPVVDPATAPVGCATPPAAGSVNLAMTFFTSTKSVIMNSGQIAYTKVVPVPSTSTKYSVAFEWFQSTNTPGSIASEVSISKCPGVIDTTVPAGCYISEPSSANFMNQIAIYEKPKGGLLGWSDQATLGSKGCWVSLADATAGNYYVNLRYNYTSCTITGGCGFNVGWIYGPQ